MRTPFKLDGESYGRVLTFAGVGRLLAVAAAALVLASPAAAAELSAYGGLGTWISIYDGAVWKNPERTVQTAASRGVSTIYVETSNYRQRVDVAHAAALGRLLDAAHGLGLEVVGWYLPSFAQPARDVRRARAGIGFESANGDTFDSFALDIEATNVHRYALRNSRMLQVVAQVRRGLPPDYALGAITIAPVGASPTYWPGFPFAGLAQYVDVFLPMEYFTARVRGAPGVRAYTAANIRFIRSQIGDDAFPVHPIGGVAERATAAEVKAFVAAAASCGSLGASLWEYERTTAPQWAALAAVGATAADARC